MNAKVLMTSSAMFAAILVGASAANAQSVAPATAPQAAEDNGLEDIIVTARRKAESMLTVPVAVSAIGGAALERANAVQLGDIAKLAPQVIVGTAPTGTGAVFNIRGIGSGYSDPGLEQSVLVAIDGVQVGRGRIIMQSMFDLEQVEVLKGPQALFFGKNSTGGVISMTSARPTDTFTASLRGGYEFNADERYVEGAVSGPLTDTLKARLAVRASAIAGWTKNLAVASANPITPAFPLPGAWDKRQPGSKGINARATLAYSPSADLDMSLKVMYGHTRANNTYGAIEPFCGPGVGSASLGVPDQGDCTLNRRRTVTAPPSAILFDWPQTNNGKPYSITNVFMATGAIVYKPTDELTFTSQTSYYKLNYRGFDGITAAALGQIFSQEYEKQKTFEQEFRLVSDYDSPVNFTLGAYFEDSKRDMPLRQLVTTLTPPDPRNNRLFSYTRGAFADGKTYSLSGQARWQIVPTVELAGGVRWTHERKHAGIGQIYNNQNFFFAPLPPEGTYLIGTYKTSNYSPEVTLSWHPTEGSTLYGAFKTGYKSGGFSTPGLLTTQYTVDTLRFNDEKAKGFEVGYKAEILDRRVRFDVTAYRYTYDNLQLNSVDPKVFAYYIKNAGKARIKGFETQATARLIDGLTLNSSLSYNKGIYVSFPGGQCTQAQALVGCTVQDLSGRPLERAPKWTGSIGGDYTTPLSGSLKLGLNAEGRYTTGYYTEETISPIAFQDGFWLLSAGIRIGDIDDRWELSLQGRNLTNKTYLTTSLLQAFGNPNSYVGTASRPREIAVEGRFKF